MIKLESVLQSAGTCFLALALSTAAFGQDQTASKDQNNTGNKPSMTGKGPGKGTGNGVSKGNNHRSLYDDRVIGVTKDDENQSKKAAQLFREIMRVSGKAIPQNVFDRAECVAAFTNVYSAGSIARGRGLVSCRTGSGWSAPVYLTIRGDNLGSQISARSADMVMMFMNRERMSSMLSDKITVGADAPAAAGPVGQDTGTSTDAVMNAQILCYMRNKGMLAGAMMDGVVVEMDGEDMRDVYGDNFNFKGILEGAKTKANSKVMTFSETLSRYTSRQAKK